MTENHVLGYFIFKLERVARILNNGRNVLRGVSYVKMCFLLILVMLLGKKIFTPTIPNTVYKHYNIVAGHNKGLTVTDSQYFVLNGKAVTITAGLIHYWRVHPHYWRDRLKKLRAVGAIAVKTAIPWNLHEPYLDVYDFGNSSLEMSQFLDIIKFIRIAKEEDLLVILGLGPYINAELDLGGLPSYLLSERVKLRTSDSKFLARVEKYFSKLLPLLVPFQVQYGGSIIMFQLENSYGSIRAPEIDLQYLKHLKSIVEKNGINGLLFTSDPVSATLDRGALPELGVLQAVNSETDALSQLETLRALQPSSPALIHFRSGCVDHWNCPSHNVWLTHEYEAALKEVLEFPASVCLHVFHGGTSFGFLSGATGGDTPDTYNPLTTSYDFDAPLTEAGDYTAKYEVTVKLLRAVHPYLYHPPPPHRTPRTLALTLPLTEELPWSEIVRQLPEQLKGMDNFLTMEDLLEVEGRKQSYGYVRYSLDFRALKRKPKMKLLGRKRDIVMVLVDGWSMGKKQEGETKLFGFWDSDDDQLELEVGPGVHRMELFVENCGRVSHASSLDWLTDKKGLGPDNRVHFENAVLFGKINITGMPFLASWITSLSGWKTRVCYEYKGAPSLVKVTFFLSLDKITDTFLDISDWRKGVVYVNGFNIGRYFCGGPQQTLYIPAPLLREGKNMIIIFEHYFNPYFIKLTSEPKF